jgi:hypothetical protein
MRIIFELLDLCASQNLQKGADQEKGPTSPTIYLFPVIYNLKANLISDVIVHLRKDQTKL